MSFFISDAMAQATGGGAGGAGLEGLILPIGLIIMLYFLMIRPQMKRQKEHKKLVETLANHITRFSLAGIEATREHIEIGTS